MLIQDPISLRWEEHGFIVAARDSGRSYEVSNSKGNCIIRNRRMLRKLNESEPGGKGSSDSTLEKSDFYAASASDEKTDVDKSKKKGYSLVKSDVAKFETQEREKSERDFAPAAQRATGRGDGGERAPPEANHQGKLRRSARINGKSAYGEPQRLAIIRHSTEEEARLGSPDQEAVAIFNFKTESKVEVEESGSGIRRLLQQQVHHPSSTPAIPQPQGKTPPMQNHGHNPIGRRQWSPRQSYRGNTCFRVSPGIGYHRSGDIGGIGTPNHLLFHPVHLSTMEENQGNFSGLPEPIPVHSISANRRELQPTQSINLYDRDRSGRTVWDLASVGLQPRDGTGPSANDIERAVANGITRIRRQKDRERHHAQQRWMGSSRDESQWLDFVPGLCARRVLGAIRAGAEAGAVADDDAGDIPSSKRDLHANAH